MSLFRIPDRLLDMKLEEKTTLRVGVIPMCKDAGASYASAYILKNGLINGYTPEGLRTLAELGTPYFYNALGFDKRFLGREFYDISSQNIHKLNMELGYNWYVKRENIPLSTAEIFKTIYKAAGNFIVFDCSGLSDSPDIYDIADMMDIIYFVIDPLPTRLIDSENFVKDFLTRFPKCRIIVNKFNKGIHRSQLSKYLGRGDYEILAFENPETVYKRQYNCNL